MNEFEQKLADLERTLEAQAETISGYQANIQKNITELTRHFMTSIEIPLRNLVRSEIKDYLEQKR